MITIVYSTHKDEVYNNKFKQHLLQTVGLKDVQILEFQNNNEYSLSEIYNKGIDSSHHKIVCCIHNDIKLENGWGKKLLNDFENNPEYGIIGKAGSCYFPESGVYWDKLRQTMVGQVYHQPEGQKKFLSKYSPKLPFLVPVVTIDGLFISFDKEKIKHKFDTKIGKFHFYDHGFAVPNFLDGVKLGVTSSFEITHFSVGKPNDEFFESKKLFVEKYKEILPLDLKPSEIYIPKLKTKPIKNVGRVGVVIPTKGKVDLLTSCLTSIIEKSENVSYEIFIADTGSTKEEKDDIKHFIEKNNETKIHLIEYDYYNFAKINNDVVKNYINESFEFILFCNNDIQLLNNVMWGMVNILKQTPKAGTVGSRLHFEDNTIQHDGIFCGWINKGTEFRLGHFNFQNYYNYNTNVRKVPGNTAGLLMIRKILFDNIGGFNENYTICFEDVELNFECIVRGFENYIDGSLVAYHFESQTRGKSDEQNEGMRKDLEGPMQEYMIKNRHKLKQWVEL
jgi:GT2 family glycosyltransferase